MAHKALLPQFAIGHARPLNAGERQFWRRFLIGLVMAIAAAVIVIASPVVLGTAVALGTFNSWDTPVVYD